MSNHKSHIKKIKDTTKDIKYNFYYGIPHAHTNFSTGKGSPKDAFLHAKKNKLDFLIITDHRSFLKNSIIHKEKKILKWDALHEYSKSINKRYKSFLALTGYESKVNNLFDINIYNTNTLMLNNIKKLQTLISYLEIEKDAIVSINHPHNSIDKLKTYINLNKYICLFEVANGTMPYKYNRYDKNYFMFLDYGWKLGAIIGQDNHLDNWGDEENLTVILAENLDKASIMKALKERRTYATESKTLKLIYKLNNKFMGEILQCNLGDNLNFILNIEDKVCPIQKVDILSNKGIIIKEMIFINEHKVNCLFTIKSSIEQYWYAVKVIQDNGKCSLSSPIFIEFKNKK